MNQLILRQEIIKKIKENRISTTEIADVLGKQGDIPGVTPINKGHFKVGEIFLTYAWDESNWNVHEDLEHLNPGQIVICEVHNCRDRAIFGDLVSKFIMLYKQGAAIVINGYIRDGARLIKENYPIWCKGLSPRGCFNVKNGDPLSEHILYQWEEKYIDGIAVCDDAGVVVIPETAIRPDFLEKLDFIELQEDIWYYCMDQKKWSTYKTVCLKDYKNINLLPEELKKKFEKFQNAQEKRD